MESLVGIFRIIRLRVVIYRIVRRSNTEGPGTLLLGFLLSLLLFLLSAVTIWRAKTICHKNTKFRGKVWNAPHYSDTQRDAHRPDVGAIAEGFMFW